MALGLWRKYGRIGAFWGQFPRQSPPTGGPDSCPRPSPPIESPEMERWWGWPPPLAHSAPCPLDLVGSAPLCQVSPRSPPPSTCSNKKNIYTSRGGVEVGGSGEESGCGRWGSEGGGGKSDHRPVYGRGGVAAVGETFRGSLSGESVAGRSRGSRLGESVGETATAPRWRDLPRVGATLPGGPERRCAPPPRPAKGILRRESALARSSPGSALCAAQEALLRCSKGASVTIIKSLAGTPIPLDSGGGRD